MAQFAPTRTMPDTAKFPTKNCAGYPIMFATLYVVTLIGLVLKLISDLDVFVDPRIDFANGGG